MIEKCQSFKTSDGSMHASIEAAQQHEIKEFLSQRFNGSDLDADAVATALIKDKNSVVDILTMKATSKPSARKVNGGTKKRSPKTEFVVVKEEIYPE